MYLIPLNICNLLAGACFFLVHYISFASIIPKKSLLSLTTYLFSAFIVCHSFLLVSFFKRDGRKKKLFNFLGNLKGVFKEESSFFSYLQNHVRVMKYCEFIKLH